MQSSHHTAGFRLAVDILPPATEAEVFAASRPFERGWKNPVSPGEALTLELSRKLQPYIGRIRKKHYAGVAKLAKELTKTRSPDDALKYLRSKPGIEWVEGYLVPDRAEPVDGAVHQAIGEAVIGVVPIGVSFPNDSINNELSPLLAKVERSTYQQGQIYASQRVQEGRLPVGVASLPWFAFFVFVFVLVVWVISIPSEMAWSLG